MLVSDRSRSVLAAALALVALAYLTCGMLRLAVAESGATDLRMRWAAQQYVLRGQNPYDVQFRVWALQEGLEPPPVARNAEPRPDLGAPGIVGDPPWAFVSGALFLWPPWPAARWTFALLNAVALAVIGRWSWSVGRRHGRAAAWLCCTSALAVGSHCTTLGLGQLGTLVVALLCAASTLERRGRPSSGGLLCAVACLKPSIAGPFLFPFLGAGRRAGLVVALVYFVVASGAAWALTSTPPWEMISQMLWGVPLLQGKGYGVLPVLHAAGVSPAVATTVLALVSSAIGLALCRLLRDRSLLEHFAVASVIGRLWTYHRVYDNVMLTFLLVALAAAMLRRGSRLLTLSFLAVGLTLWVPSRAMDALAVQALQIVVWVAALGVLLVYGGPSAKAEAMA